MSDRERNYISLLPKPPLLITESAEQVDAIRDAIEKRINPRDIIEEMYVSDIGSLVWEIVRLRRCRAGIVNAGYRMAMEQLFPDLVRDPVEECKADADEARTLAWKWFRAPQFKEEGSNLLKQYHLEDSVIEAIAVRNALPDLERLDKLEASCQVRYQKALRGIADYRDSFAQRLREAADRIIDGNPVLRVEDASCKPAAT